MKGFLMKATLLLLCVPSAMVTALLSPAMVAMCEEYAQFSATIVTMIVTIPTVTVLVGLFMAPALVQKISIKTLLLVGMVVFTVCNVLSAWCSNLYLLLLLRGLSGIGCGLILPLQVTFVATYPEKERATLMGLGATVSCLFAAVLVAVAGMITTINWRLIFFLYLINVVTIFLTIIYIPKHIASEETSVQEVAEEAVTGKTETLKDYWKTLFLYYFLMIGAYLFLPVLTAELAPYLQNISMGGPEEAGLLMSISLIGSMLAGLALGQYLNLFKGFSMGMIFLGGAVGFALLWMAKSIVVIGVAVFIIGVFSSLVSCVVNYELSKALPLRLFTPASAGTSFFIFVLQFVAPIIFVAMLGLIPSGSFRLVFLAYAIIQAIFILLACVLPKFLLKV